MNKIILFLVLIFSLLIFSSCSQLAPVTSDICKITEEICYYATNICDLYGSLPDKTKVNPAFSNDLQKQLDKLKEIHNKLSEKNKNKFQMISQDDIFQLISIKENLRRLSFTLIETK